jgi:acylphosphatase
MRRVVQLLISGRVQGVGYRAWVAAEAARRGLDGWVRNRADGSVEAVFAGEPDAVARMIEACRRGPPSARVTDLAERPAPGDPGPGFRVLPTV